MPRSYIPDMGSPDLTEAEKAAFKAPEEKHKVDMARYDAKREVDSRKNEDTGEQIERLRTELPEVYASLKKLSQKGKYLDGVHPEQFNLPPGHAQVLENEHLIENVNGDYVITRTLEERIRNHLF